MNSEVRQLTKDHGNQHDNQLEEALAVHRDIVRLVLAQAIPTWLELDLTMPQLKAFAIITNGGPVTIGQVSEHLGVGPATASHLVDKLVRSGLVERQEDTLDRRRTLAGPSTKGAELAEQLRGKREKLREWLSRLNTEELEALTHGMWALREVIQSDLAAFPAADLPCDALHHNSTRNKTNASEKETQD